jgi:hypothetical protein
MKMVEIRKKAKALGISADKMEKPELIHSIQKNEGYTPCFGESNGECNNTACCFMEDCLKLRL